MARKSLLILAGILVFALALRVYKLSQLSLYGDELTMVEDSYSLLKTGRDQTGALFPLTFKMGAGRPAGYVYFSIPFVALFGPSAWGVRGLSVLSSLGIILVAYFLVKQLLNQKVALLASFLVAVSPWDLSLARGGFESHFALFLALWGVYLLLKVREGKWNLVWAILLWGLTVNTYPTYKLILSVLFCIMLWFLGGIKNLLPKQKSILILAVVLAVEVIGLTLAQTFVGGSENRFLNINLFASNKSSVEQDINFNRSVDSGSPLSARLFYNKPLSYFKLLGTSYLKNFSVEYLVINGDGQPRHNMTGSGVIYVVEIVTIFLGIKYFLDQKTKRREFIFILSWLLIAPIAAAFTLDNHGLRTNFMLPPLVIFSSLGIYQLIQLKKPLILAAVVFIWLVQFVPMLERLYFLSPNRFARFWSNMAKVVATESFRQKGDYDYIVISSRVDNVEYAYPVYNRIDPKEVIAENTGKSLLNGYKFKQFGNVYIGSVPAEKLTTFFNLLPGKVKYYGPFDEAGFLGAHSVLYDKDKMSSVLTYEK